ncbi:MAG TPA: class I SAM-dependent methyltransferase [Polyangia bacterium]|nr:class I SAM-dependent methyltransferase [Polyangia bacterium]
MPQPPPPESGTARVRELLSGEANPAYLAFHRPRFQFLVDLLRPHAARPGCRVLDVGTSPLTGLLARELGVAVDSLGLEADGDVGPVRHYRFDLNEAQDRRHWRTDLGPYDVIVFAEVLEHLYTAPELVLAYLRERLAPGGLLVVQTPNAVALRKRVKMLLGRQPFERIRVDRTNPGHFREYTAGELRELLAGAGFALEAVWLRYYFDARYARHDRPDAPPSPVRGALKNVFYRLQPAPLREGITIAARARRPETI